MEFAETRDPLGFVGARVMRHSRKARRRRQRTSTAPPSSGSAAMKHDPGADDGDGDDEHEATPTLVLYGWLTRYDTRLDAYTLFLPDGGGATLYPRAEVLKFVSNPEFQLRTDVDDAFPPPVEDLSSRFVGAPMRKRVGSKKTAVRSRKTSLDGHEARDGAQELAGRVVCYRPFADLYRARYDDGSTTDVSESDVVDALLVFAKRTVREQEEAKEKQQQQQQQALAHDETAAAAEHATSTTRKRRRSEDMAQPGNVDDEETEDEETEDEEPPVATGDVKEEMTKRETTPSTMAVAAASNMSTTTTSETSHQELSQSVVAPPVEADPEPEFEFPEVDDDEPMELLPLDDDDDDDDMNSINAALRTTTMLPPSSEIIDVIDDDDAVIVTPVPRPQSPTTPPPPPPTPTLPLSAATPSPSTAPRPVYLYYVVQSKPHTATQPFDKRSMAFEFLRTELTQLLDADECAKLETSLVADVMTNRDIKDRDAVRRFVETGGLVVINCVLNARARDALARPQKRYDRVLFVLKLLAMLPTPSEQLVMESSIGKTIGRFMKSRMNEQQAGPDAAMPKCIAQLARWIKHKWLANMDRAKKPDAPTAAKKKHLQRPTQGRPSGQRSNDPTPIPRRSTASFPTRPPQVPSFAAATGAASSSSSTSTDVLGAALSSASSPRYQPQKSTLKPDWMRQKETLTRTRFTINTDANAERQHYQRDRMNAEAASRDRGGTANARAADDAGARGVFGRSQKLSFGPRWSVCEFYKDAPPSAVRRTNSNGASHYRNLLARPKPILRKRSKYRDKLTF